MKKLAVKELSKYTKVFISAEGELPTELEQHRLNVAPEEIHHVLYYASLFFADSGTMSSESAVLGTPAINVSTSAPLIGVFKELEKYGLMYVIPDERQALDKAIEILKRDRQSFIADIAQKRERLLKGSMDLTRYLVWFLENYPVSRTTSYEGSES